MAGRARTYWVNGCREALVTVSGLLGLARVSLFLSEALLFSVFVLLAVYLGRLGFDSYLAGLDMCGMQFSSVCLVVISLLVPAAVPVLSCRLISLFVFVALSELISFPFSISEFGFNSCLVRVLCVHLFHVGLCMVLSLLFPASFLSATYVHRVDVLWVVVLSTVSGL
jgi:hypothetical protein